MHTPQCGRSILPTSRLFLKRLCVSSSALMYISARRRLIRFFKRNGGRECGAEEQYSCMFCVHFQAARQAPSSTIPAIPVPSSPAEKPPSIDIVEVTVLCTCFIVTLYQPPTTGVLPSLYSSLQIIVSPGVEV